MTDLLILVLVTLGLWPAVEARVRVYVHRLQTRPPRAWCELCGGYCPRPPACAARAPLPQARLVKNARAPQRDA